MKHQHFLSEKTSNKNYKFYGHFDHRLRKRKEVGDEKKNC